MTTTHSPAQLPPTENLSAGKPLDSPEEVGFSAERLEQLDAAMQAKLGTGGYPGITVMVARHGHLVHARNYGVQDVETGLPLRSDAIYRIASMTKPIVGAGLMLLYEAGAWQLDDPVAKFLPAFTDTPVLTTRGTLEPQLHPMTIRELITSTGGLVCDSATVSGLLTNGPGQEVKRLYQEAPLYAGTVGDAVDIIASLPLASQPGTRFQYGMSHDVQGRVIEVISGQPLDEFLTSRLFKPLGMVDTDFGVPIGSRERLVPLATYDESSQLVSSDFEWGFADPVDPAAKPAYLSGRAGLFSTMADYLRFTLMLAHEGELEGVRVLAPSSVRLMRTDLLPPGVPVQFRRAMAGEGYGVGVGVVLDPAQALVGGPVGVGTYFWSGAHGNWFWIDPVHDLVVMGMVQVAGAGAVQMGGEHAAPDLRALSRSLVYAALVDPER